MRKGQALLEYGLIISLILAVIVTMQTYIKRGIQAQIKISTDGLGRQEDSEEFDIKKGLLMVSGERRKTSSFESARPTQQRKELEAGVVETGINEKNETLAFTDNPLPDESIQLGGPDFFATDKRSGSLYYQGFQEEFEKE